MGKKNKFFWQIVFFPFVIIFLISKKIVKLFDKHACNKYLSKINIKDIDGLNGNDFEEVIFKLLKNANLKVEKTPKSRDFGADLIVTTKYEKIVLQCKLYYNHTVGNSAIQEINTAKKYYNASLGIVITNSYFTKPAQTLAKLNDIKMLDRNDLCEFLASNNKQKRNFIESL